ncbi:2451_t:CDS:2, partial [Scutellospora calospora]
IQILKRTDPYPCIITLYFHHNHSLKSSHVTSFHPISDETKSEFFRLFESGHNPDAQNEIDMFDQLEKEITEFNTNNKGNAWIQTYIAPEKDNPGQPFILVIVTNLMLCCHTLQEAGELVYIDTTAGLDALNTPLTILSTSTPASGLPLGIVIASDESAETFTKALDILKRLIPSTGFGKRGTIIRPQVVMTDDCKAEKMALCNTWKDTTLLLCVFHFLQAMWQWLWNSKHGIHNNDRITLIEYVKKIVFAKMEATLNV